MTSKTFKALLLGAKTNEREKWEALDSFEELKALATTAGLHDQIYHFLEIREFNAGTLFGKGQTERIKNIVKDECAAIVIVDHELSPVQTRNLEVEFGVRVLDRTGIILDIFALHAKSREGQLQVELAQYEYLMPRLVGAWTHLSKQRGGGVGLRGPGETQLEVDRRRARERISRLKKALEKVISSREIHHHKREVAPIPTVTLVGYTNAGKSTLFNSLVDGEQEAVNKLFATLDPKTKKLKLPSGREILLSDTVGFIRNLPHQLVKAFQSTFSEAGRSDILLHVVDVSHPYSVEYRKIVEGVLKELNLEHIPLITVLNKVDCLTKEAQLDPSLKGLQISASKKTGFDALLNEIENILSENEKQVTLLVPHARGDVLSLIHRNGRVISTKINEEGTVMEVSLPDRWRNKLDEFKI